MAPCQVRLLTGLTVGSARRVPVWPCVPATDHGPRKDGPLTTSPDRRATDHDPGRAVVMPSA